LKRAEKERIVSDLHEKFLKTKSVFITDFRGLNVSSITELRDQLREVDVEYRVVKNTLVFRASEGTDMALLKDYLVGPSAVVLSYDDPVAPAKVLVKFAKENENLKIKAGVLEGKVLDVDAIRSLSELPSRDILLQKLMSVLNSAPTGLVGVLSGIPRKLLYVLHAIKEKKAS